MVADFSRKPMAVGSCPLGLLGFEPLFHPGPGLSRDVRKPLMGFKGFQPKHFRLWTVKGVEGMALGLSYL